MNDYTEYAVTELQKLFEEHQREMISQVYSKVEEYVSGFLSENVRLRAELAAERERNRWIPVGERLPERAGAYFCVVESNGDIYTSRRYYHGEGMWHVIYWTGEKITHWSELREPPTEDE